MGIISLYFINDYKEIILFPIMLIIVGLIKYFILPDLLCKETEKFIENYYDTLVNENDNINDSIFYICNIRKWDGPMFGILKVEDECIEFTPFKKNLREEKFFINSRENNINNISIVNIKWSIIDRIFFKDLSKAIRISYDKSKMSIQLPRLESCARIIKEKLNYNNIMSSEKLEQR